MNDEIYSVLSCPDLVEISPSVGVTRLLGSPVNQSLNALVLGHSSFTGSLRVGVIVIVVVGSSVLPTVKVLVTIPAGADVVVIVVVTSSVFPTVEVSAGDSVGVDVVVIVVVATSVPIVEVSAGDSVEVGVVVIVVVASSVFPTVEVSAGDSVGVDVVVIVVVAKKRIIIEKYVD